MAGLAFPLPLCFGISSSGTLTCHVSVCLKYEAAFFMVPLLGGRAIDVDLIYVWMVAWIMDGHGEQPGPAPGGIAERSKNLQG